MALRVVPPFFYWINPSRGLRGYEKRATTVAYFAEMKKNIHDKKLEQENKELKEIDVIVTY